MDRGGSSVTKLTNNVDSDNLARWSPDHQQIVYVSDTNGQKNLYLMRADGSEQRQLTTFDSDDPMWAPDGSQIVFVSNIRSGNADIYTVDIDSTTTEPLTANSPAIHQLTSNSYPEYRPVWSPDGTHIAFQIGKSSSQWDIEVLNLDTNTTTTLVSDGKINYQPMWSPDGSHIAYVNQKQSNTEIYIIAADGSEQQRITEHNALDDDPTWSPDSQWIIFHSNRSGNGDLWRIRSDGDPTTLQQLTTDPANDLYPFWGQ